MPFFHMKCLSIPIDQNASRRRLPETFPLSLPRSYLLGRHRRRRGEEHKDRKEQSGEASGPLEAGAARTWRHRVYFSFISSSFKSRVSSTEKGEC